ncbi:MAG: DUF6600 domain-containing protein [Verrucomicrobiota bacterium]
MKRILLALTILALFLPLARQAEARTDVSLSFFYDNLGSYGNWIEVGNYGYCFQPSVTVSNSNWRPYTDGYWAYTDVGWTWVSYEDFGWATYHYGRWTRLQDYGWIWVPGYEWGPSWVSWRTGGDYVGWAPLPPYGEGIYEGRAITGAVDIEFDIGPSYYNFVDLRYIGEPVLRDRIFAPERNITIINNTVNVTNITYNNSTVYNYGPDYNRLNQYSTRPIQRLSLERQATVDANVLGSKTNLNKVEGGKLLVVAPTIQKSAQKIAPKTVKAKVDQPKIERGWTGVSDKAQIQQRMKAENAKEVPPPTFQPTNKKEAQAPASTTPATGEASVTPAQGAERKGRKDQKAETPAAAPAVSGTAEPSTAPEKPGKGRHKGVSTAPGQTGAAPVAPEATQPPSKHKGEHNHAVPAPTASQTTEEATSPMERGKGKGRKGEHEAPTPSSMTSDEQRGPGAESPRGAVTRGGPEGRPPTETVAPTGPHATGQAQRPGGPQHPAQAQSPQERRGERAAEDKRKKKRAEVTASPTP